jgi:hypothetical protein
MRHGMPYTCTCLPPATMCNGVCTDTDTNIANCGGCGTTCNANQNCANGVCVGTGNLQATLIWDKPGDMDLHIVTPNNKHIYFSNKGTSVATDWGTLDVDDLSGTGPENIFWALAYTPPSGTYHVCVVPYSITPTTSYTLTIKRPGQPDTVLTGSYSTSSATSVCTTSSPHFVTSFSYP